MAVEIRRIPMGGDLRDFLDIVDYIYRDDPKYVRSLDLDVKSTLSSKNPFFEHAEGVAFTAYRNGWCLGRCTAQIDRLHLEKHKDDAGFFGFLDTVDDAEATKALLDAAAEWLAVRGMKRMRGPYSLSTNEQIGCLVEGFDTPPMVMMPHHRPYQDGLIQQAGLSKCKDLYAWRYEVGELSRRVRKAYDEMEAMPEVKTRSVDLKHMLRDVRIVVDVFNDAWSDNWGYIPLTDQELKKMAEQLRLLVDPAIAVITEIDGEAAGVGLALPNINEVIGDLNGKLLPIGFAKLLWRLKVTRPKTARLALLGIRKKFRASKKYGGLSTYMYAKMSLAGVRRGYQWGELSWTLEDNHPVNLGIKVMGGKIYKRYRLYEREI